MTSVSKKESLKVLFLTPAKIMCGNLIDVQRTSLDISNLSHKPLIYTPQELPSIEEIKKWNINIVHSFHAYKSRNCVEISKDLNIPCFLTMTGTDYNEYSKEEEKKKVMKGVLDYAQKVVFFHKEGMDNVIGQFSIPKSKCVVLERNMFLMLGKQEKVDVRKRVNVGKDKFVFTLIAGIRPVKNVLFSIESLKKLNEMKKNVILLIVGPVIDEEYWKKLKKKIDENDFIVYCKNVDRKNMRSLYEQSDVVINTSYSEGGSLVVVETMSLGVPLLANSIEGNIAFITKNMKNGVLYDYNSEEDFFKKAKLLYEDESFRKQLGKGEKERIGEINNPDEGKQLADMYFEEIKKMKKE